AMRAISTSSLPSSAPRSATTPTSRAVDARAGDADTGSWSDMGAANRERFDDAHQCHATSVPAGNRIDAAACAGMAGPPTRQELAKRWTSRQKMPADDV